CTLPFRPRANRDDTHCPTCWRRERRGERVNGLLLLLELLIVKRPGVLRAASKAIGVSRSSIKRWRNVVAAPKAEHVLALDTFVRAAVVVVRAEELGEKPLALPGE